jgi:hypothetical protein
MRYVWKPIDNYDPTYNQQAKTPAGKLVARQQRPNTPLFFAKAFGKTIGRNYRSLMDAKRAAEAVAADAIAHAASQP